MIALIPMRDPLAEPIRPARLVLDACVVFAACVALYWVLRQQTCYGVDAWNDMRRLNGGDDRRLVHLIYMPMASLASRFGATLGVSLHDSLQWMSNLGMAFGVTGVHVGLRHFGVRRNDAWWASGLTAAAPGLVFYATVVERHGPFFGFAGLAFVAAGLWARCVASGWRAVLFGVTVGLAYAAHSTGVLLVPLLVPLVWVFRDPAAPPRRVILATVLGVAVAAACVEIGTQIGIDADIDIPERRDLASLKIYAAFAVEHPLRLPIVVWREYLFPLAPIAWIWIFAWFSPAHRRLAVAASIGVVTYVGIAFLILAGFDEAGGMDERGAYLLPLALPTSWLTVRLLPSVALRSLALVVALAAAVGQVVVHDARPQAALARTVQEELAEDDRAAKPFWLLGDRPDFEMLLLEYPDHRVGPLEDYLDLFASALIMEEVERAEAVPPVLIQVLRKHEAEGRPILMTAAGRAFLRAPRRATFPHIGPLYLEALERAFEFVPLDDPLEPTVFRLVSRE